MRIEDIGLLGGVHMLACVAALLFGAWNIVVFDRGRWHRLRGDIYAWSMIVANLLVFAIYDFDMDFVNGRFGPGIFGFFHWLAVAAIAFTGIGWFAARRQQHGAWAYVHPVAMTLGYYILVGGLINEAFARVDMLRPLAYTMTEYGPRFGTPISGMTQGVAMLATLLLIVLFIVRVAMRRHKRRQASVKPAMTAAE